MLVVLLWIRGLVMLVTGGRVFLVIPVMEDRVFLVILVVRDRVSRLMGIQEGRESGLRRQIASSVRIQQPSTRARS